MSSREIQKDSATSSYFDKFPVVSEKFQVILRTSRGFHGLCGFQDDFKGGFKEFKRDFRRVSGNFAEFQRISWDFERYWRVSVNIRGILGDFRGLREVSGGSEELQEKRDLSEQQVSEQLKGTYEGF